MGLFSFSTGTPRFFVVVQKTRGLRRTFGWSLHCSLRSTIPQQLLLRPGWSHPFLWQQKWRHSLNPGNAPVLYKLLITPMPVTISPTYGLLSAFPVASTMGQEQSHTGWPVSSAEALIFLIFIGKWMWTRQNKTAQQVTEWAVHVRIWGMWGHIEWRQCSLGDCSCLLALDPIPVGSQTPTCCCSSLAEWHEAGAGRSNSVWWVTKCLNNHDFYPIHVSFHLSPGLPDHVWYRAHCGAYWQKWAGKRLQQPEGQRASTQRHCILATGRQRGTCALSTHSWAREKLFPTRPQPTAGV